MNRIRMLFLFAAIAGTMSVTVAEAATPRKAATSTKIAAPPAMSNPLSSDEVYKLYANRSWIWKTGAGYFAVKMRGFTAWTGDKGGSYGVGHWFVTAAGKLCFQATWYANSGKAPALTCFSHRRKGNVVFQKREPDGEWYAFKTVPAKPSDEYNKIKRGDYVTSRYNHMRKKLASAR
ncbi:hypothetical protein QO002_005595 [Pararhizobium capsulatum DSM 1112]|uniref:DUF995 domain-containing protein n=1 Tax=Pararhizobium capsulatum DSM 1112 TaxID=1121113 RepID=A0ABU0BYQ8_9HYPH|nr:DUF995 domain-containing protein [Pararhizobium capsulatum]MDQ0323389.1 hypothetical protein [Pararhizobium capsulatum DSM 1112]